MTTHRTARANGEATLKTLLPLALALSEDLRNKVLDALFGAEEEFDYTSTTTAPPPPTPAPTAS